MICLSLYKVRLQLFLPFAGSGTQDQIRPSSGEFDWDSVTIAPYLDYSNCYDGFQCARLELPMDYWNGSTDAKVDLAVVRRPAAVPVTHPQYGGAILLNPGGPGGSGVDFLRIAGRPLSYLLDSADGKYFDLISFDPRGVGRSTPKISCFQDAIWDQSWNIRARDIGSIDSSDAALGKSWAMSQAKRESCSMPLPDGQPDVKQYATTAFVARDMLEIVERHGKWREQEARRLLKTASPSQQHRSKSSSAVPESLKYRPGKEKIQYFGFSYGTFLGSTFAAMFPDRISRFVLDGVIDAINYKQATWSHELVDAEKAMDSFYDTCAQAGYPACPLANQMGDTKAQDIRQLTDRIIETLLENPLPILGSNPDIITYSDIRNLMFASLYVPLLSFPRLATILAGIEKGDGHEYAPILEWLHTVDCKATGETGAQQFTDDAIMAIACGDGDDQSWVNRTTFEQFSKELLEVSPTGGAIWAEIRMHCIHYTLRPIHRYIGPWTANTSHPILFIGNKVDPVTPAINAYKMAAGFDGAVTLLQDSVGHTSLSAFSNCTMQHVRKYFQKGELPPVDTTCAVHAAPFGLVGPKDMDTGDLKARGEWHAVVAEAFLEHGLGKRMNGRSGV